MLLLAQKTKSSARVRTVNETWVAALHRVSFRRALLRGRMSVDQIDLYVQLDLSNQSPLKAAKTACKFITRSLSRPQMFPTSRILWESMIMRISPAPQSPSAQEMSLKKITSLRKNVCFHYSITLVQIRPCSCLHTFLLWTITIKCVNIARIPGVQL